MIERRHALGLLGLGTGGLLLAGCDRLNRDPRVRGVLRDAEGLTLDIHRLVTPRDALAREYAGSQRSPVFRSNGTSLPDTPEYQRLLGGGFRDWRLAVDGLVARPLALSLDALRGLPQRTQVTRHDCVEGWSAIAEWTGVPLGLVLREAGLRSDARYVVFHCADRYGDTPYYESIDLVDAFHPQTILAHRLNGAPLPVANGAPLRLRVERQLGYKHAKYLMRVTAVATLAGIGGGRGGTWEDTGDYAWYAGI